MFDKVDTSGLATGEPRAAATIATKNTWIRMLFDELHTDFLLLITSNSSTTSKSGKAKHGSSAGKLGTKRTKGMLIPERSPVIAEFVT